MVSLLALLLAVGCSGDPTDPLRGGVTRLDAAPSQLFLQLGESKTVDISAVDEQGNQISSAYEVTATTGPVSVKRDSTFLPVYINDSTLSVPPEAPIFRYLVTATGYGSASFTVSAAGKDVAVPVQVTASTQIAATFSNPTPALGDTITLTAPAGTSFTQTAELTLPGAPDSLNPRIIARDPGGAFVRFVAPPNVNAAVTITEVVSSASPTLTLSPATVVLLKTPLIDSVDVTFSTSTPTLGQTVTATSQNPLIKFDPSTDIQFQTQLNGRASGPQAITVAADSNSLTFQAPPNATGPGAVSGFAFPGGFVLSLPTRQTITAPNIGTKLNATVSDNTPGTLEAVTITAPAGFTFGPLATDTVTIGGQIALKQSVAVDGSTITVIPIPGSSGTAEIAGVSPTAAPQFILTLSTVQTITAPALTPLAGTDDPATAPSLTIPTAGTSLTTNDAGAFEGDFLGFGFPTRFYKLEFAAPTTITFTLDWFQGQDLGLYIAPETLDDIIDAADSFGEGPGGHPETVTVTFAPGIYYAGILNFSSSTPSFFQIKMSNP